MNILLCLDDISWDYSRHAMVTLLSLFETNPKYTFYIYILSSYISEKNQSEITNIVYTHWSHVFFSISPDIIPVVIKDELIVSRPELTPATFYRLFFCEHIDTKNMDKILYIDCDTLFLKNIWSLYKQDMWDKIIAGSWDLPWMQYLKKRVLWLKYYINAWVLLIDVQKYKKIDLKKGIQYMNKKYGKKIQNDDQDYLNLIFHDALQVRPENEMNCIINRKYFIDYRDATILHLTNKPHLYAMPLPKELRNLYYYYLNKTIFRNYTIQRKFFDFWIAWYSTMRSMIMRLSWYLFGGFGSYWTWKITKGPVNLYIKIVWK